MREILKKVINRLESYLKAGTQVSLMRLATLSIVWTACLYVLLYVIVNLYLILFTTTTLLTIDWIGVSGFISVALAGKYFQKTVETKDNLPKKEEVADSPQETTKKDSEIG